MTLNQPLLVSLNCDDVSSHMDIAEKILSDPVNKWVFSHAKKDIFLVGGYIRDLLRGGYINKDKDYILKNNIREIALSASHKFKGTFIEFKKDRTFRVALKSGQFLDFSCLKNTIIEDLNSRDFRINAIAWSPEKGIIDPFNGEKDLKNKLVRVVKPENLVEDPLRILRAYRIASQLGLAIDKNTRNFLRKYSDKISDVAAERITQELFKLLLTENASYYIAMSQKDKVLHEILDVSNAQLKRNITLLNEFDNFIVRLRSGKFKKLYNSRILPILNLDIGQGLSRAGLIRLSILSNNLNRAQESKFSKLKYSKSIMKRVTKIQDGIRRDTGRITVSKLYHIFKENEDCEYEAALLVSVTRPKNVDKFLKRADYYIKIKKNPLINGYEIQNILNINPSSLIGKIQSDIQKRSFLGIIRTKREALHWIISNLT